MPSRRQPAPHRQSGFTLLELLVVLTIMGFLIAMVAPRLAGISAQGVYTVTQTNMDRLVDLITADLQANGKYPTGMINIVSVDGSTGVYHKPMISDQDPDTGYEVLSHNMDQRHRFFLHYLSPAEAAELRALGVVHVYNYNSPFDRNVVPASPSMEAVDAGVAVLMTGGGDSDNAGAIEASEHDRSHPDEMFRLVFGLGPETSLIKRGLDHGASTCPESGLAPINYEWKWYCLLLPRLKATEERLTADDPLGGSGSLTAYAVDGAHLAASLATAARREVDAYAAQNKAFFAVLDSEGAVTPTVDMTGWGIDFDANGDID
jgi:prepilin-type N-terminal cleavage/methylation domain-containing protein